MRISGLIALSTICLGAAVLLAQAQSSSSPRGTGGSTGSSTVGDGAGLGSGDSDTPKPGAKPSNPTLRDAPSPDLPPPARRPRPGEIAPPIGIVPPNAGVLRE